MSGYIVKNALCFYVSKCTALTIPKSIIACVKNVELFVHFKGRRLEQMQAKRPDRMRVKRLGSKPAKRLERRLDSKRPQMLLGYPWTS